MPQGNTKGDVQVITTLSSGEDGRTELAAEDVAVSSTSQKFVEGKRNNSEQQKSDGGGLKGMIRNATSSKEVSTLYTYSDK